jgi:predicted CopG family antitoxin
MSSAANEHVRVSQETKERLRQRKRESESFNDAISRLLDRDRDLLAGFGAAGNREGATLEETVSNRKDKSKSRIERLAEGRTEGNDT